MYIIYTFTALYADIRNYVHNICIYRILRGHGKLRILYIHSYTIQREYGKLWLLYNHIYRILSVYRKLCILYIHIYRILRVYGKLCILYIHIYRILRGYGKQYCILIFPGFYADMGNNIVYSYFQDSTRIWETTKGLEIVSLSLGWKRISSNSWLNVQLLHNPTRL